MPVQRLLLDNYRPGHERPHGFVHRRFDFDHDFGGYGDRFAISRPGNPEEMTAYRLDLVKALAHEAGLKLVDEPLPQGSGREASTNGSVPKTSSS
jgi:hypothetical protein